MKEGRLRHGLAGAPVSMPMPGTALLCPPVRNELCTDQDTENSEAALQLPQCEERAAMSPDDTHPAIASLDQALGFIVILKTIQFLTTEEF